MNEVSRNSDFLRKDSKIANYMIYPRFLVNMDLSETAKLIYVLLLDRGRLSIKQGGWAEEDGKVYIYYGIQNLAADIRKSTGTVKAALKDLEAAGLILRAKQESRKARKIYVKVKTENCPSQRSGFQPPSGQKTGDGRGKNLTHSKKETTKTTISRNYTFRKGESL